MIDDDWTPFECSVCGELMQEGEESVEPEVCDYCYEGDE